MAPLAFMAASRGMRGRRSSGTGRAAATGFFKNPGSILILAVVGFLLFKFGSTMMDAFRSLFEGFGILDSKDDKKVESTITDSGNPNSPWNGQFWKNVMGGQKPMYYSEADGIVKQIWGAAGGFDDDEDAMIAGIKKCRNQAQISFVVERFSQLKSADLIHWLKGGNYPNDRLSSEDLAIIINYVERLPKK